MQHDVNQGISDDALSARLSDMADTLMRRLVTELEPCPPQACAGLLIEAARVLDYENVRMLLEEKGDGSIDYPSFDLMCRGWNPLAHLLLPRLEDFGGIRIRESTPHLRSGIRGLLHSFGQYVILKKASDMALHGYLSGTYMADRLELLFAVGYDTDHFADQLDIDELEHAFAEHGPQEASEDIVSPERTRELMASLVFPFDTGHGRMVGYGADTLIDAQFTKMVSDRALKWRSEAGLHPV